MVLGNRIRQLRRANGMSQENLGKLIGVSKVSVSGYEKGTRIPSMIVLEKMVDVFNISADYLLGRELDAVCEDDNSVSLLISSIDVSIIKEIKNIPSLYNAISKDPKRFFASMIKNNIYYLWFMV